MTRAKTRIAWAVICRKTGVMIQLEFVRSYARKRCAEYGRRNARVAKVKISEVWR